MKGKTLSVIFAVFAVSIMASSAVAVGFATTSFTATTTSASNSISADYFTAGIYNSDQTTVPTKLIDQELHYTSSGGVYTISSKNIGKVGICIKIDATNHTPSSYSVTGTWSVTNGSGIHK